MTIRRLGVLLSASLMVAGSWGSARAQTSEPIVIGSCLSTSGTGAGFGTDQLQAVELAVRHINASGGVLGRPFVLKQRDTGYDKVQAQSVMRELIADKNIVAVIGPTSSAEAFAADPAAVAARLPVLAPANGAQGIPQIGAYVHRIGVPEELLLPAVTKQVVKDLGLKTAAIFYAQNDPFAVTGFRAFQASLKAEHVDVVQVIGYDSKSTVDFTAQIQRVREAKPDAIFAAILTTDGAVLVRQLRQAGVTVPIVGNLTLSSPAIAAAAGEAINGLILGAVWDPEDSSAMNQKFVADFKRDYGRDPPPPTVAAYNSVHIIKEAIERSKDASRAGVQKGMLEMDSYHYVGLRIELKKLDNDLTDAFVDAPVLYQYRDEKLLKMRK
jgi:branched-chain amino acid transport system substrate-binding protein